MRSWWHKDDGGLSYTEFPGLSPKSNKRSHREVVDDYLRRLGITPQTARGEQAGDHDAHSHPEDDRAQAAAGHPQLADVLDALMSVKAAAAAALDAVLTEAESAAQQAQAHAQQAQARVETYKKLRTALHGYDMALSVLVHPDAPPPDVDGGPTC